MWHARAYRSQLHDVHDCPKADCHPYGAADALAVWSAAARAVPPVCIRVIPPTVPRAVWHAAVPDSWSHDGDAVVAASKQLS